MIETKHDWRLAKVRKIARYKACQYGFEQYADDITQEVLLIYMSQPDLPHTPTIIRNKTVDVIRKMFGDSRDKVHEIRQSTRAGSEEFDEADHASELKINDEILAEAGRHLERLERAIIFLTYKWNFSAAEVADVLGYNHYYIPELLTKIRRKLAGVLNSKR